MIGYEVVTNAKSNKTGAEYIGMRPTKRGPNPPAFSSIQRRQMPHSHHSHSGKFCKHASGTLEEVVQAAIKRGFKTFALTEHCPRFRVKDLYLESSVSYLSETRIPQAGLTIADLAAMFDAFLDEAIHLRGVYADQVELLVGVETEHIFEGDLDLLKAILERNKERIDFVVGSVHHANEYPIDFSLETFEEALGALCPAQSAPGDGNLGPSDARKTSITALFVSYFQAQRRLLEAFQPALVAHFDLPRLFIPSTQLSSHPEAHALALDNIKYAVSYGALFELSAAPFRKGWETGYPGDEVVRMIQGEGGKFALSDDSHGPERVGLNFDRLKTWARALGIDKVWKLARRSGKIEAVQVNDVWDDEFWSRS